MKYKLMIIFILCISENILFSQDHRVIENEIWLCVREFIGETEMYKPMINSLVYVKYSTELSIESNSEYEYIVHIFYKQGMYGRGLNQDSFEVLINKINETITDDKIFIICYYQFNLIFSDNHSYNRCELNKIWYDLYSDGIEINKIFSRSITGRIVEYNGKECGMAGFLEKINKYFGNGYEIYF